MFCLVRYFSAATIDTIPGGPIVRRLTTVEVEVEGSNLTRDSFFRIDRPRARERALAEIDARRRALTAEMWECLCAIRVKAGAGGKKGRHL